MRLLLYCLLAMAWPVGNVIGQTSPSTRDITGKVTNEQGEPLVNANVTTNNGKGTVTNSKGQFLLKNVPFNDVLQVSFIGYTKQSVPSRDLITFNIVLSLSENELDKVVVQAYGQTSRRFATGNIGTISAEDISKHPVMNPIQIIQGMIPGAVVTNANGSASSSVKIEIRGRNTIDPNMVSEPLYILDGVPMTILNLTNQTVQSYAGGSILSQGAIQSGIPSDAGAGQSQFFGVNPNDIESIEVLKDADATAIYGSRAANGVILITTKKKKVNKTHAEVSVFTGLSQVSRYYSLLNTQQYIAMRKEALQNDGLPINSQTAPDLVNWDTTRYTDWQKYIFGGTGRRTSIQTSISGGDNRTNFRSSAGFDYDKDIITERGGNYRGAFSLSVGHKSLNQKLNISWSVLYSLSKIDVTNYSASVLLAPNAPAVFDERGNLNYSEWSPSNLFQFGGLLENYSSKTNLLNTSINLKYEVLKGLFTSVNVGYNNLQNDQTKKIPIASQDPSLNPKGSLRQGNTGSHNLIIEPKVEYTAFIKKGKQLSILFGGTAQTNETNGFQIFGSNYENDLMLSSINNAPQKAISHNNAEYKYAGLFTRINFNLRTKYIINLSGRRDGSSRFGPGRQFGNFGSLGTAWIFTEEKWAKSQSFLSFGKIRGSYGITGSDEILNYQYLSLWQYGGPSGSSGTYNSTIPINPIAFSDSLLQWEVNKKLEISLSLAFFKDRISLDASWYKNRCNNQLVPFPTPALSGFTSVTSNTPAHVQNTGWEFIINAKIFDSKKNSWSSKLLLALNRNKLLAYPNFEQSQYRENLVMGKPLNIQKVLHFTSIDPNTGDYMFEDYNHDGLITTNFTVSNDDRQPFILTPKYDGSLINTFGYKKISLSTIFYFRKQFGTNILVSSGLPGTMSNQSTDVLSRWQKPGDFAEIGKFTTRNTLNTNRYYNFSDARITDASFIRLQNISFSYQFSDKVSKSGIRSLKVYAQAENLFVITKYKGIDPETQNLGAMPRPRIITVGLSCNL